MSFALIRSRPMTRAELRRAIPYSTFIAMLAKGSLTGFLPTFDHQGIECEAATPLTAQQRIDIADKLLRKGLPDLRADDEAERPTLDATTIASLDPEQAKRMTVAQIQAAIEASFTPVTPELPVGDIQI